MCKKQTNKQKVGEGWQSARSRRIKYGSSIDDVAPEMDLQLPNSQKSFHAV